MLDIAKLLRKARDSDYKDQDDKPLKYLRLMDRWVINGIEYNDLKESSDNDSSNIDKNNYYRATFWVGGEYGTTVNKQYTGTFGYIRYWLRGIEDKTAYLNTEISASNLEAPITRTTYLYTDNQYITFTNKFINPNVKYTLNAPNISKPLTITAYLYYIT